MSEATNVEVVRAYLRAIEARAEVETIAAFFTPDAVQREFPNRLVPQGATRDVAALREGMRRGRQVMSAERYEVLSAIASGETVAMEVAWSGTLAVALGTLPAGGVMRATFGVFFTLRDGRIASQRNYDCFEPF